MSVRMLVCRRVAAWTNVAYRRFWVVGVAVAVAVTAASLAVVLRGTDTEPVDSFAACAEAGYVVTDGNRPTCRVAGSTFTGPATTAAPVAEPGNSYAFDLLVSGDLKNDRQRSQVVIRDQAAWETWWARLHEGTTMRPPLLDVDFTSSNVVIIVEGPQETDGYVYKVTGMSRDVRATVVDTLESVPTIGCAVNNQRSNRYVIVRTSRLSDPVVFRNTEERRQCGGGAR